MRWMMKITDDEIIYALKAGKRITSNGMPAHCFLQADVDFGGRIKMLDWGQDMGYDNLHWSISALSDTSWRIADDEE